VLTLSTDTLKGYSLDRIFRFAKELEIDGIDLAIDLKQYDTLSADYLIELKEKYKLPITSIQTPSVSSINTVLSAIELAKKINCRIIIVQPPKLLNHKYASWLKKKVPLIRKKESISIALENAPNKTYLGFIPEYTMNNLNELKNFKHACLDTTRVAQRKEDLIRVYTVLKDYLVHIHLSNMYRNKSYYLPQTGVLPMESFLAKLKQENYKGAISIKVNPKHIEAEDAEKAKTNLKDIKKFYEKYFINS